MAAGLHPFFMSVGWVPSSPTLSWEMGFTLLVSILVLSQENQRPLAPSSKDLE